MQSFCPPPWVNSCSGQAVILFLRQRETLDMFLEKGAITQAQHDKSLHDLIEKMGMKAKGEPNGAEL